MTPCATFDTRPNQGAANGFEGSLAGDETRTFRVVGTFSADQGGGNTSCGIPTDAAAVLVNLVAVDPVNPGNLRVSAAGVASSGGVLNFSPLVPRMDNSNAVIIPVSAKGELDVAANAGAGNQGLPTTHTRAVVLGYLR
ncbi:MAG: hypothetical protein GY713_02890 [Actinomycetia bacterium]|nr:hypothetical protein [Actinomycetes bacterium]